MTEEGYVVSVKGSVIRKAAFVIDKGWLFSRRYAFVGEKQTFFGDVFFRSMMQRVFEQAEQIALGDKAMSGNLADILKSTEM